MLVGRVVRNEIEDDLQAEFMRLCEQRIEILKRAEERIDAGVIRNVVAEVRHRGDEDWRNPDRIDANLNEIRQPLDDAAQIADAVAVAVLKRAWINLIDDAGLPPRGLHHAPSLTMTPSSGRSSSAPDTVALS